MMVCGYSTIKRFLSLLYKKNIKILTQIQDLQLIKVPCNLMG